MKPRYIFLALAIIVLVYTIYFLKSCADSNMEASQQSKLKFDSLKSVAGLRLLERSYQRHYIQFSNLYANDMAHAVKLMDTVMLSLGYTNTRAIYEFSVSKPESLTEKEIKQVLEANYRDPYLRVEIKNHASDYLKNIQVNFRVRR